MMTAGNGMEVVEILWIRKGVQLPKDIYVVTDSLYYTNNSRIVVPTDNRLSEGEFTYGTMANYNFVPTLLFLRKGEIDENSRKAWELGSLPLFKVVNGKEGVIPLPHLAAEADKNKADRFWDTVGQRAVAESGAIVGSMDSNLILFTLREYYLDEIESNFEEDASAVPELLLLNIKPEDVVIGISASGSAYYVQSALAVAKERGAYSVMIQSEKPKTELPFCNITIPLNSGYEVVAGSTRMKSGTAQKLVLNMISTTAMIQLGRVEDNKMVNMQLTNAKVVNRGVKMLMEKAGIKDEASATTLLLQ